MVDPAIGMKSLQEALRQGVPLSMRRCESNPQFQLHIDQPDGKPRLTYFHLEGAKVTAIAMCVPVDPYDGVQCFGIAYAVHPELRGQGRAKLAVRTAIEELRLGFGKAGLSEFFVEAIVSKQNAASQRVAEQLHGKPVEIDEALSGEPAFKYVLKVTA